MQKTENKTTNSVRSKLVAAIAMLLVATIMVVSSTYAWFTLSTKPEVSGISTAVGANGALEMLLATEKDNAWFYGTGEVGTKTIQERNTYWGNLVDLSDKNGTYYGSKLITLYPATLNIVDGKINSEAPINTPEYGADGRVEQVTAGGMFGIYSGTSFLEADNYGFRAVGMASGLSEREQAFRVAVSQIMVNASSAQVKARTALSANGNTLASIAIKKAMKPNEAFTSTEIAAVGSMITGIKEALAAVEAAYLELIYATIYSSELNLNDLTAIAAANAAKSAAETETSGNLGAKIAAVVTAAAEKGVTLNPASLPSYTKFQEAVTKFTTAQTKHGEISGKEECTWSELSAALYPLVDIDKIKINDYTPTQVKDNTGAIASQVIAGKGINVVIPSEGGVFADIADYAGDYTVAIQINTVDLKLGVDAGVVDATMKADSTLPTSIFAGAKTAINDKKPSGDSADKPLTEFYGYAIDLAFRTNASTSNLLLQTAAADRIYKGNQNEETMGKGSTMTFATTDATFTKDKMLNLMSKFEVVFYDTTSEDILGYAKLDTNAANVTGTAADGLTANLLMLDAEGNFITEAKDAVITDLDPNVAQHVTVLVYLNGETIENKDVAASAMQSMSGTFNIQFASSADLQPMEYSDLHTAAPAANNP